MKVVMLKTIKGNNFSFLKGEKYQALDGDKIGTEDLVGKILVRQPNSSQNKKWWCSFSKEDINKTIAII